MSEKKVIKLPQYPVAFKDKGRVAALLTDLLHNYLINFRKILEAALVVIQKPIQ